jgi:curli production assembly/transport component CsgE
MKLRPIYLFAFLIIGLSAPLPGLADEEDEPLEPTSSMELMGIPLEQATGFIVDRTITNFGAQFVHDFSQAWRTLGATENVDLTIVEKPSARWGSTIFIEHNNHPVAHIFLQAGRSATIKPLAENAARYMASKVADNSLLGMLMRDPDLASEELPR